MNSRIRTLPLLTAVALIAGLVLGFVVADGNSTAPVHNPSGNAIGIHVALGVVLVAVAGFVTWRTGSLRWLGAPWSRTTGQRFRYTFAQSRTSPLIVQRAVGAVLVVAFCLYLVMRVGMQFGYSTDPEMYVNAWGGPTVVGAFLAHLVDAVLMFGAACLVGHAALLQVDAGEVKD
ncbi:MAG TPA: hypothetical protein H9870_01995 [Candidatus Corynebacterium avicola]|uniref:Uncharacterized protein n=1 Tax=Candidatus Corynebacterium avicola TaxID=2838527 RepID=A0A9D1RLB2_9CORY|nr:hypothetical protein [Candidatus Corynebacterium avicola]